MCLKSETIVIAYDARENGGGDITPTITGDHQNRVTDYTAIVLEIHEKDSVQPTKPKRSISRGRYIGQSDSLRRFLWRR